MPVTGVSGEVSEFAPEHWFGPCYLVDGAIFCRSGSTTARVDLPGRVLSVDSGSHHACAVLDDRTLWCWGDNSTGELGRGFVSAWEAVPAPVIGLDSRPVSVLSSRLRRTCVLAAGEVFCWGDGVPTPTLMRGDLQGRVITSVAAGYRHACAVLDGGAVACWGNDEALQGGNSGQAYNPDPRIDGRVQDVVQVVAGADFSCARTVDSRVVCWGYPESGRTGNTRSNVDPVSITLPAAASEVSCGEDHACAITIENELYCWGSNDWGQLGDGGAGGGPTPLRVRF